MNRLMCAWKKKSMGPHTNSLSLLTLLSFPPSLRRARTERREKEPSSLCLSSLSVSSVAFVRTKEV